MDFKTVFQTFNSAEADLVKAQLEAAGFEPAIVNEFSTLTLLSATNSGGVGVQVPEAQAADARALIESTINAMPDSNSGETPPA